MKKCQCSQCGSTEFLQEGTEFLRCVHCNSLFRMMKPAKPASKVIIGKGANVVFGSLGKVTIGGELIIESGANVSFLGELDVIQKASPDEIEKAKQHLKLIKDS
jgi:DNA-directed RNA polymerase subunit RPC12/RpoP